MQLQVLHQACLLYTSPAQDFANGFATFVAQNTGAGKLDRVRQGIREAVLLSLGFCAVVAALVFVFARPLLTIFIDPGESAILDIGVHYLRVEGVFYVGIGMLFLLYAIYRGLEPVSYTRLDVYKRQITSSISVRTSSGRALGRSILLMTGTISRS